MEAKNSSKKALQTRRKACWLMKNRKLRFRFTANLSKRSEADAIRRTFKELHKNSPVRHLIEEDSSDGDDEKVNRKNDVGNSSRRRITSWEKCKLLGRGSFGIVHEGITDDGFFFAIKEVYLLDPGSQDEKLQQEISILSQLDHENIVRYLGSDKDDNKLCIFLELMTKGSLATLYHKHELRDSQVSEYTRQILNGLKYLHGRKVVHRDIKCANILVDASGLVKIADFGLAKATAMNAAKTWAGSAFWMAPEVVNPKLISSRPERSYGLKVDIWSLGCTVLEMLIRQHPYPKLEWQALFQTGRGERPPVPLSLSSDARDFILKCLAINPKDRPSATKLLHHPFVRKPPTTCAFASSLFNDNSHNAPPDSFPNGVQEEIDPSASNLRGWHPVSAKGRFKRKITLWKKCQKLEYGRVGHFNEDIYEVNTDDGSFLAVNEHVLLDPPNLNRRLLLLKQEISLLFQCEHENIVQYLGIDEDDKNLYIFLEPMAKGSVATFYARNKLRDSQVSAYTRQILNGLRYLHEQKLLHRYYKRDA